MNAALEQLIVNTFKLPKEVREKIEPGVYQGQLAVMLDYDIKVGADYEQRMAPSVPWMRMTALLFSKVNGVTMESVMREALDAENTDSIDIDVTAIKDQAAEVINTIMDSTRRSCKGKVTGKVVIA